jgi:regulator of protease activity HflC (stomatin/prohibitin superfamily)
VDLKKAQLTDQTKRLIADMDSKRELYLAALKANQEAQAEQLRAAINEQSQIINAQANEQKALADTVKARLDGLAKLVDATAKVRMQAEKAIEKGTRGPQVIALPAPDDGSKEMQAQALQQMAQAVQVLGQSLNGPRPPLRVIRDAGGNIAGVQ